MLIRRYAKGYCKFTVDKLERHNCSVFVYSVSCYGACAQQRGRSKQEEFIKKVQEMLVEQEKQRIRVAQGLPWTTDEPEVSLFYSHFLSEMQRDIPALCHKFRSLIFKICKIVKLNTHTSFNDCGFD